jgi:hypothetical protein
VPFLPSEQADWGQVQMKQTTANTNIYAATSLTDGGAAKYLETLKAIFS